MTDESQHIYSQVKADDQSFRFICESIQSKHSELLDSMPDGVIITDTSGRIVLVNSQIETLFGYGRRDLVAMMIETLVPVHLREGHVSQRNSYLANPCTRPLGQGQTLFGRRQDGGEVPVEISLSPIQTDVGFLVCAAVRDVSERIRVEKTLRASEEQVRSQALEERYFDLYANSPDMCASIEAKTGRIVDCNNTLVAATGYTREELLAIPHISHLYHPDSEDARKESFRTFLESGSVRDAELRLMRKDGSAIDVSLSLSAVRDETGEIVRGRSVWRDITSRRRTEKVLRLIVEGTSLSFGEDYFRSLVRQLANALEVRCAFVSELREQREGRLRLLAYWNENNFKEIYEYDSAGTPCELVIKEGLVCFRDNVQHLFRDDQWLKDSHIESYLAVSLLDLDGKPIGHLGIAHDKPLPDTLAAQSILQVSSKRAGAELLRMRAEEALRQTLDELEMRVQDRTAELAGTNIQLEREIAERTRVEHALRANEEHIRLVLDSTAEAIYGQDEQGICTFCNRACVATLGYDSSEELLGQNMHNLVHHTRADGSDYPMHECRICEALRLGEGTYVDDEVLWRADGSSFPAAYRSFPVRRDGELVGLVVTFLDITEQKRVAEVLLTQQSELTHAARLSTLGEMAAGLAHELNQPLTAMSAFAEGGLVRLDRGKLRETEIASAFSRIAEEAQRAGDIIRRLRNFVQKREAQRHPIDVNRLVHDIHKFAESDAKQEGITIQFELGNGLPEVEADPIEIQQVLLNLIRNAHDALAGSDSDERTILISSHERNPDRVELVVEDSGPGISDSMAEQVFEPFYTSKADGLGIGLRICQNIIEAHRGKMWLGHSSMGGASVHFDLPSCQQEDETDAS